MKIVSVEYIKGVPRWDQGPKDDLPEIAVIGRSNVGKSSLINFLVGRKKAAYVSKTPGKTQLIHFFLINRAFYLVDLPGYGYARTPRHTRAGWGPMIESYFLKRRTLSAVALLIDIRHPNSPLDKQMFEWLKHHRLATLFIATKGDKMTRGKRKAQANVVVRSFGIEDLVVTSSAKKEGRADVWTAIENTLSDKFTRIDK
ncbi:YihA family ribosome biogenesis GTP-binding protein [Nitrospira defluvii]|nr:YihA family ribosome biogenesis GTP-binding protein [Nitrospira defluvii]